MNSVRVLLLYLTSLFLIMSCGSGNSEAKNGAMDTTKPTAIILKAESPMWAVADGKSTWKASIPLGEQVYTTGNITKATQGEDGEREYVSISRSDNSEGWIRAIYLANNATLGVVKNDGVILYNQPKNTNATATLLASKTLIAVYNDGGVDKFYKVALYDAKGERFLASMFLRADDVSTIEGDTQSTILLQLALAAKGPDQKKALLSSAIKDYPNSFLSDEINGILSGATTTIAGSLTTEVFNATMTMNDSDVFVRSKPDVSGNTLGKLTTGDSVTVVERTVDKITIEDKDTHWYHISMPTDGWVYGAFIEGAD